jgi:divalent metal cation (Fe/Co/Zn/Cd) transporter
MALIQISASSAASASGCSPAARPGTRAYVLQGITLVWMLVELGFAAYAAVSAHSPVMFAFGSDSLVEVLSATAVLLQWVPRFSISERTATRTAAVLLFVLACVVGLTAIASLVLRMRPEVSVAGVAITAAALVAMPILARLKRSEGRRSGNTALVADAAQTATCAYLALIALVGMGVNAWLHLPWFDAAAALVSIPFLIKEGRSAWQGNTCACC